MNTGITMQNKQYEYEDVTHGGYGFIIWLMPMLFLFFFYVYILNIYLLVTTTRSISEDYLMMCFSFFALSLVIIWFGSSSLYALQTVQFIQFNEKDIFIRLYFNRKVYFYPEDLLAINDFKINKLMSQTRTFPEGGTGILIHLKNGKRYRVSPHMARFEELKAVLTGIAARNK
ncbi:hypothetical protein [Legionella fairfieldensis]|uniref:hypothetical protein n=1 Tax=Legionella fairfieldensis TaxID=45064 RepID=UPI000AC0E7DD|nr:hypothetical protein [Legionella fairfieldensis]